VIEKELSVRATETLVKRYLADGSQPASPTKQRFDDPNVRAAETKLRRALGTQVRITQTAENSSGKIEITFFNNRDLDRVYQLITKPAGE
jgi:hypothetical protein